MLFGVLVNYHDLVKKAIFHGIEEVFHPYFLMKEKKESSQKNLKDDEKSFIVTMSME
jgi:hypothetical protein